MALAVASPSQAVAASPAGAEPDGPRHAYALTLEYDGSGFRGWQRQAGRRTVEGSLLEALAAVTGECPPITAAGRTDAGAHAHGQVVGLSLRRRWESERLRRALNARLPEDVAVVDVAPALPGFHARFDAIARTYRYVLAPREVQAVGRQYAWLVSGELDVERMRRASRRLVGTHDFAAFGRSPRPGGTTRRTVHTVEVRPVRLPAIATATPGPTAGATRSVVLIDVSADAFLYGMMRAFAGALVAVGTGRLDENELGLMVDDPSGHRQRRHAIAPAHGLHQWQVSYPRTVAPVPPCSETP